MGKRLGIDFLQIFLDFGCQVGPENPIRSPMYLLRNSTGFLRNSMECLRNSTDFLQEFHGYQEFSQGSPTNHSSVNLLCPRDLSKLRALPVLALSQIYHRLIIVTQVFPRRWQFVFMYFHRIRGVSGGVLWVSVVIPCISRTYLHIF